MTSRSDRRRAAREALERGDSRSDADLISYALVTLTVNRQETIAAFNRLLAREQQTREALERAVFLAEHLFQMVSPEEWRATGGDDGQGHYEGDYRAAQTREEIVSLKALAARDHESPSNDGGRQSD